MKDKLERIFLSERAKDIYKRAAKTFLQAFLGSLSVSIAAADVTMWKPAVIAAVSAGISALMNTFIVAIRD